MEDRIESEYTERRGTALIALAAIIMITAAWWALALWPAGAAEPEWLVRTRAACFGSARGGLPNAGGWILLIGEPIGMAAALLALWGRSLRRDIRSLTAQRWGRLSLASVMLVSILAAGAVGVRIARALPNGGDMPVSIKGVPVRVNRPAPPLSLVDQRGRRTSLADFHGQSALVTFAFGHCSIVCPSVVADLRSARRSARRESMPIVIITLDPWRDTPERLPSLARHWQLAGDDRVLSGSITEVESALDALGIGRKRNKTTGDIDHTATVMILDENGSVAWRVEGAPFSTTGLLDSEGEQR